MTRKIPLFKHLIKYIVLLIFGLYVALLYDKNHFVIDGDTLRIGREIVRLDAIDAPELKQECLCHGEIIKCGMIARAELYRFIDSKTVLCETRQRDLYGRLIGECFIHIDGRKVSLNEMMIQNGLAMAKYSDRFLLHESEAIRNKRGFWSCEKFESPSDFRRKKR